MGVLKHDFLTNKVRDYDTLVALHEIGVVPFSDESVANYMRREQRLAIFRNPAVIVGAGLSLGALATALITNTPSLTGIAAASALLGSYIGYHTLKTWRISDVDRYKGVIPIETINIAKKVAEKFQRKRLANGLFGNPVDTYTTDHVRFRVHYFHTESLEKPREIDPFLDPFLTVQIDGGKEFFISVWNEPDFPV